MYLLDLYLEKLPKYAFENDLFYLRPKKVVTGNIWFESAAVGKEKLRTMVKQMCAEAGIENKTNHSLRATGVTTMFASSVPEKIIGSISGHRSVDALRTYERPSHAQLQEVSEILTSGEKRTFGTDLSNTSHVSRDTATIKKQNCVTVSQPPSLQGMLFGNLANCTVNITPKNFVVNINPGPSCPAQSITDVEEEFDSLVKDVVLPTQ